MKNENQSKVLEEMTSKQISIMILIAFIGIVVVGLGLLAFSLSVNPVRQDSNPDIDLTQPVRGIIARIEPGKDGVQSSCRLMVCFTALPSTPYRLKSSAALTKLK